MRTSGIFTICRYEIPFKKYGEPIYVIPFGDVHRSAELCDVKRWIEFLDWAKKKSRCYFLGMGDYDDLASTSERKILMDENLHDSTRKDLEKRYDEHTRRFAKEIGFMKGRLIGLIEGNHYSKFSDGTTTTQRLCQYMDCKYLGVTSFICLHLIYNKIHSHRVVIWAHHGLGAGRTTGGSINRVEQMEKISEADVYLMGHDHKKSVAMLNKFAMKDNTRVESKVHVKKILLARTGTFLRGYMQGEASYIADAGMSPTDLGVIKIELTPRRLYTKNHNIEDRYIDIHCSI